MTLLEAKAGARPPSHLSDMRSESDRLRTIECGMSPPRSFPVSGVRSRMRNGVLSKYMYYQYIILRAELCRANSRLQLQMTGVVPRSIGRRPNFFVGKEEVYIWGRPLLKGAQRNEQARANKNG